MTVANTKLNEPLPPPTTSVTATQKNQDPISVEGIASAVETAPNSEATAPERNAAAERLLASADVPKATRATGRGVGPQEIRFGAPIVPLQRNLSAGLEPSIPVSALVPLREEMALAGRDDLIASSLHMSRRTKALRKTWVVEDPSSGDVGAVRKRWTPFRSYKYRDSTGRVLAKGRATFSSFYSKVKIRDEQGKVIAKMKKHLVRNPIRNETVYWIQGADGKEMATAVLKERAARRIEVSTPSGQTVAEVKETWPNSRQWTVNVFDPSAVDPRILLMIPPFVV